MKSKALPSASSAPIYRMLQAPGTVVVVAAALWGLFGCGTPAGRSRGVRVVDTPVSIASPTVPGDPPVVSTADRRDVAFLFGSDHYESWPDLPNGVADVRAIGRELRERFGFEVYYFFNLPKKALRQALLDIKAMPFGDADQVLVYVTGHGYYEPRQDLGFVVPVDARRPAADPLGDSMLASWQVVEQLNAAHTKHLLVILDVCYGGTIFRPFRARGTSPRHDDVQRYLSDVLRYRTRRWVASSDHRPVSDGVPGHHSPFTRRLLEALRSPDDDGIVNIAELMAHVERVGAPRPITGEMFGNEPGSDFLFIGAAARARLGVAIAASRQAQ